MKWQNSLKCAIYALMSHPALRLIQMSHASLGVVGMQRSWAITGAPYSECHLQLKTGRNIEMVTVLKFHDNALTRFTEISWAGRGWDKHWSESILQSVTLKCGMCNQTLCFRVTKYKQSLDEMTSAPFEGSLRFYLLLTNGAVNSAHFCENVRQNQKQFTF